VWWYLAYVTDYFTALFCSSLALVLLSYVSFVFLYIVFNVSICVRHVCNKLLTCLLTVLTLLYAAWKSNCTSIGNLMLMFVASSSTLSSRRSRRSHELENVRRMSVADEQHSVDLQQQEQPLNLSVWTRRVLVPRLDPRVAEYVSLLSSRRICLLTLQGARENEYLRQVHFYKRVIYTHCCDFVGYINYWSSFFRNVNSFNHSTVFTRRCWWHHRQCAIC